MAAFDAVELMALNPEPASTAEMYVL